MREFFQDINPAKSVKKSKFASMYTIEEEAEDTKQVIKSQDEEIQRLKEEVKRMHEKEATLNFVRNRIFNIIVTNTCKILNSKSPRFIERPSEHTF